MPLLKEEVLTELYSNNFELLFFEKFRRGESNRTTPNGFATALLCVIEYKVGQTYMHTHLLKVCVLVYMHVYICVYAQAHPRVHVCSI